ncbi:MAG: class I SAM-dependent methyltransferase [Candidatus Nealsonbacteria bacterium]
MAKKFGRYHTEHKYITGYPNKDPEKVFKEKLIELSGKNKIALDVGCADGRFTLSVAPDFQKIVAIDLSEGMLEAARRLQKEKGVKNVSFEEQDAFQTPYEDGSFDLVYNRRGPSNFSEAYRILKIGGYFAEIDIGEKDCQEIKEVFGRGQNFGQWNNPRIKIAKRKLKDAEFEVIFIREFFYNEYYASYEDLDLFLQGVPIFEDFDLEKDKNSLEKYVTKFEMKKGIKLPRHRIVVVSKKPL